MHGRQISENFVTTRELLHHISHSGKPAVFAKIDFQKAFDSIDWDFLIRVMRARQFPDCWIGWIQTLWTSSSSRVCINGQESHPFFHKRGLRQGDPLSPMLFNVAVDVFQCMVQVANFVPQQPLSNKIDEPVVALQYADDTAVIARADIDTLVTFKLVLRLFTAISGLKVNYSKSIFIPLNVSAIDQPGIRAVMGCKQTTFPVTYLGMPLTLKRPNRQLFVPLIERIEKRLTGWQSKMLSRGGRLELVQIVLSSVPVYYMICFKIPKWVLSRIDRARRRFLWGKSYSQDRGISLCNWEIACLPKKWGGLGISDLYLRNASLLLRWWWKGYNERQSMWTLMITKISWQGNFAEGPALWSKQGSFFWGDLISIKHLFTLSTCWIIGDGRIISYWYDAWGEQPLASIGSRCIDHACSLQKAFSRFPLTISLSEGQLDELRWKWSTSGDYSAKSIYQVLVTAGRIKWEFNSIWRYAVPPSVQIFVFFLLKDRLLIREVLLRRHFNLTVATCPLCNSGSLE